MSEDSSTAADSGVSGRSSVEPETRPAWTEFRRSSLRTQLTVLLVVVHVFAMVCMAIPATSRTGDRRAWQAPHIQRNFAKAATTLEGFGMAVDSKQLESVAFSAVQLYLDGRRGLQQAIKPYVELAGMRQRWRLFSGGAGEGIRTEIAVQEAGQWRVVYLRGSPELSWKAQFMAYYRTRKLCGRARKRRWSEWRRFADWLAPQAARDFPNATRLRLRAYLEIAAPPSDGFVGGIQSTKVQMDVERQLERLR